MINMIRYAGIEFDNVEDLIAYKKAMESNVVLKTEGKTGIGISNNVPTILSNIFGTKRKQNLSKQKATEQEIVEYIGSLKRKKSIKQIFMHFGYQNAGMTYNRFKAIVLRHGLAGKVKFGKGKNKSAEIAEQISPHKRGIFQRMSDEQIIEFVKNRKRKITFSRLLAHFKYHSEGNNYVRMKRLISENGLMGKMKFNRMTKTAKSTKQMRFSKDEVRLLIDLYESGKSLKEIAIIMNLPHRTIINKAFNLGLSKKASAMLRHKAQTMQQRKPFVPMNYTEKVTQIAQQQAKPESTYAPFPAICNNEGMLRIVTKDLINKSIQAINIDYADHFGVAESDWSYFLGRFMENSDKIAKHFEIENKFVVENNSRITYG
jgi:hypothetical protein